MAVASTNLTGGRAPPSVSAIRPLSWAVMSAVAGAGVFGLSMAALWRDLPGLPQPVGTLATHAGYWLSCAAHWALPALQESRAAQYASHLRELADRGELGPLAWRAALSGAMALAPAVALSGELLRPSDGLLHMRGPRRFAGPAAARELSRKLAGRAKVRPDHPIAPGAPYPADLWTEHVLIVGGVGAGKSTALMPLLQSVILARERLIAFDAKGEFTSAFVEPVLIAPWDSRSFAWDVARDISEPGDIRKFASALIPEGSDAFWAHAARQVLVGLLNHLRATKGESWGWADLARALMTPATDLPELMRLHNPEAVRSMEKPNVTAQGILINLSAFCAPIFDLAQAWGATPPERRVSFADWALGKPGRRQIFIQGHGSYPQLTAALAQWTLGVVAGLVCSAKLKNSATRKLWVIADEAAQMGKAPLRQIAEMGRSKGARVVIATQDFSQLEEVHGKGSVQSLVSMCGTLIIGRVGPGETAAILCKALGEREVERRNVSATTGASAPSETESFSREDLALYKPSELATRLGSDGKSVVMALITGGDAHELRWPIKAWPQRRSPHKPAAWLSRPVRLEVAPDDIGADSPLHAPSSFEGLALTGSGPPGPEPAASHLPRGGQRYPQRVG